MPWDTYEREINQKWTVLKRKEIVKENTGIQTKGIMRKSMGEKVQIRLSTRSRRM